MESFCVAENQNQYKTRHNNPRFYLTTNSIFRFKFTYYKYMGIKLHLLYTLLCNEIALTLLSLQLIIRTVNWQA